MTMNKSALLEQALKEVTLEEFSDIPSENEICLIPSEKFQKNCKRLIQQSQKGIVHRMRSSVRRAILIAALIAVLAVSAVAIPDVREAFVRFFVRNESAHYVFYFDPEQAATAPNVIEKTYCPTYIPAGYTMTSSDVGLTGNCYFWFDESYENYIMFDQTVIGGVDRAPYAEDSNAEIRNLNGYQVFCVYDEATVYYWTDNKYFYSLYCGPAISEEEMQRIFLSIDEV